MKFKEPKTQAECEALEKALVGRTHVAQDGTRHVITHLDEREKDGNVSVIACTGSDWFYLDQLNVK